MQPELRHLRAFLAVADQASANRAGPRCFVRSRRYRAPSTSSNASWASSCSSGGRAAGCWHGARRRHSVRGAPQPL